MHPAQEQVCPATVAGQICPTLALLPQKVANLRSSCRLFSIRRACPEDAHLVHNLVRVGMLAYAETAGIPKGQDGQPDLPALKETPLNTAAAIQKHLVLLASEGGQAAGTVRLNVDCPDTVLFERFAVSPSFQGQGLARHLFHEATDIGRQLGQKRLVLYTAYGDLPALKLYKKWGFEILNIETNGPYPRARMQYDL